MYSLVAKQVKLVASASNNEGFQAQQTEGNLRMVDVDSDYVIIAA
jgi:hypothetical protein